MAIASGLLLAFSFPRFKLAGMAWIAPGLMLFSGFGQGGRRLFRLGYLSGLVYYFVSLYWLLFIPAPLGAISAWLALSAYCAFYPAVWVWLCWRVFPVRPCLPQSKFQDARASFLSVTWAQRLAWALACGTLWVSLEMLLGRFLTGFPWNFLGVSQFQMLPVIQIASLTGVYGISFLIVWISVSLGNAVFILISEPGMRLKWRGELVLPFLALFAVVMFGFHSLLQYRKPARELKIALVQPSIPQSLIWNPQENANRFKQLLQLSEFALTTRPELLVWPEAALPSLLRYDQETYQAVTNLVRSHGVWLILGSDDAEPRFPAHKPNDVEYFNSSFLIDPEGQIIAKYRKERLVIFGEYVPLARWLPFMKYLTPITGGFTPGDRPVPFHLPKLEVTTSVLICFEDVFPHCGRNHVSAETDFLLNLTNNGWFGESAAQWQHAANAVFRAVENGLPLVRCANNGLTCWVDSVGRLHEVYFDQSEDIYRAGFKIAHVPLIDPEERRSPTLYFQYGDWFGWSCVGLSVGLVAVRGLSRQRRTPLEFPEAPTR
jgi:apolipoprotein N-acyltransferase